MSKSVSIPIALSELRGGSARLPPRRVAPRALPGFLLSVVVSDDENQPDGSPKAKLYGSCAERAGLSVGDEVVAVNGISVLDKTHHELIQLIQQCIRSRSISLRVKRKSEETIGGSPCSEPSCIQEIFLVSINKENIASVKEKLSRRYPDSRVFDMEEIATVDTSNQLDVPQVHNGFGARQKINRKTVDLEEEKERLKKYDEDIKERRERHSLKQKQNDLLRSSLRASTKLKALAEKTEGRIEETSVDTIANLSGYSNECYVVGDTSYRENLSKHMNNNNADDTMPLDQVIRCAERIAEHLQSAEGREDDSRLIRDFFHSKQVQTAIQATSVHKSIDQSDHSEMLPHDEPGPSNNLRIVTLYKEDDSYLGATVRSEENRLVVGRVVAGGMAERSGLLREGDELLEINGCDLRGKNVSQVCEILRGLRGELRMVVCTDSRKEKKPRLPVTRLRALFDYQPEDDIFVPCRELALSFRRGDVMHILDRSDSNWWQATKDGERDDGRRSLLAGIIPSPTFRQQVIEYNEEIASSSSSSKPKTRREAKHRLPEILKTATKKGVTRDEVAADENAPFPLVHDTKLLLYEEVCLHLARSEQKRPLVIVGAEGVGCLTVRQTLIERHTDRLVFPVPFTSRPARPGEKDGLHFHFVNRATLLEMHRSGEFVEFGEFEKHLYGTAKAEIASLRGEGRTPLLSLKPQSIPMVRCGFLMPFIVLLAPPSLLLLKKQMPSSSEETLRELISNTRAIEKQYGHYLDDVVLNSDVDQTVEKLFDLVKRLETEPFWVPSEWVLEGN